jgi:hypothetical protein
VCGTSLANYRRMCSSNTRRAMIGSPTTFHTVCFRKSPGWGEVHKSKVHSFGTCFAVDRVVWSRRRGPAVGGSSWLSQGPITLACWLLFAPPCGKLGCENVRTLIERAGEGAAVQCVCVCVAHLAGWWRRAWHEMTGSLPTREGVRSTRR